jgi:hypothetical protein
MVLALSAGFGMLVGWAMGHADTGQQPINPLMFLVFFFAAIFVHELGHVAGALIVRFQVKSFTVGPLTLQLGRAGLRLRRAPFKVGGFVGAAPVGQHDLRRRMLLLVVAGPISSFFFGLLSFALRRTRSVEADWMSPFAVISAAMGVLSLIPMRRFYLSDGAQIWDLLRSPQKAERHCALLALLGAINSGVLPGTWTPG